MSYINSSSPSARYLAAALFMYMHSMDFKQAHTCITLFRDRVLPSSFK